MLRRCRLFNETRLPSLSLVFFFVAAEAEDASGKSPPEGRTVPFVGPPGSVRTQKDPLSRSTAGGRVLRMDADGAPDSLLVDCS